jgi:hypothetical protein
MSSETCRLELESPSATLPPAKWAVICTDEQFWDSRLHVWRQTSASIRYLCPAGFPEEIAQCDSQISKAHTAKGCSATVYAVLLSARSHAKMTFVIYCHNACS